MSDRTDLLQGEQENAYEHARASGKSHDEAKASAARVLGDHDDGGAVHDS